MSEKWERQGMFLFLPAPVGECLVVGTGWAERKVMKPIENESYEGVKQIIHDDMSFVICHACGENDVCTENYIKGEVSIADLPDIKAFRVPVIKKGTKPNKDDYYRLEQLIFHIENGNLKIDEVKRLGDDQIGVFFDIHKRQILCDCGSSFDAIIRSQEYIIGRVTKKVYLSAILWNFLVPEDIVKNK